MIARVLPLLLLIAAAPAPETDPFLAAMDGKSGPDAVAAPSFDPDVEAVSWTTRPRREIVDALAARLLRGEAKGWYEPAKGAPALPAPPSRFPAGFEAGKVEVSDRLAARIPADAAAVFFGSLEEAETAVDELAKFLPKALPVVFADAPGGRRDALARAVEQLLLPTIWRSNPAVRRGTRQAALLASDPDLRWAPEIALVVEVEDASLVRFHRLSTLSFENRGAKRLRVDGLDAVSDDGSVRSFFALEGGIAVWSTGKAFRDRILAAAAGKAPTLLAPDPRGYALARATFPAKDGGPLLVIPDGFLDRANSAAVRGRRAAALRCDAARLISGVFAISKEKQPFDLRVGCPSGGTLIVHTDAGAAWCTVHGSAANPAPAGDLPGAAPGPRPGDGDLVASGGLPVAARWHGGSLEVLVPPGVAGAALVRILAIPSDALFGTPGEDRPLARLAALRGAGRSEARTLSDYGALFGEAPASGAGSAMVWKTWGPCWERAFFTEILHPVSGGSRGPFRARAQGGVLRIGEPRWAGEMIEGWGGLRWLDLPLEWR